MTGYMFRNMESRLSLLLTPRAPEAIGPSPKMLPAGMEAAMVSGKIRVVTTNNGEEVEIDAQEYVQALRLEVSS